MHSIQTRLRSSGRLVALYRGLREFVRGPREMPVRPGRPDPVEDTVRELRRVEPVRSPVTGYRLNLLIPTMAQAGTFGGIRTALDAFEAIATDAPARRVVAMATLEPADAAVLAGYSWTAPGEDSDGPRQVVSVRGAGPAALSVGPRDVFVATFWPTAELISRLRRWQATTYGSAPARWSYLVQDHEPGFYPWSAPYLLARATYDEPSTTVAIYNTDLLRQAFHELGIRFAHEYAFEPRMAPELRAVLAEAEAPRSRRIVVYGRPRTPRNAFPAIVDGLRAWLASDPEAGGWSIVSAGQPHPDIDLGGGMRLESLGKLDVAAYGRLLRRSAIGVSLMVSPHPSYPPLEMAHLGMLVATNRFGPKDLATWHPNISSLGDISAESIATTLANLRRRFEADPSAGGRARSNRPDYLSDGPQFPFAGEVEALLRAE